MPFFIRNESEEKKKQKDRKFKIRATSNRVILLDKEPILPILRYISHFHQFRRIIFRPISPDFRRMDKPVNNA